jgi:hypothetical protein
MDGRTCRWTQAGFILTALGIAVVLTPRSAAAFHTVFDTRVERFSVDGNVFGAPDGQPDRLDEFDDGSLANWVVVQGTAYERDGFLHLASPGTHVPDGFGAVPGLPLDISQVYYSWPVYNGAGSFTSEVRWDSTTLEYGNFNHASLFGYADPFNPYAKFEVVGVAISNPTPPGEPAAYEVVRFGVRFLDGVFQPLVAETVPLDPSTITGQIVVRHVFDDGANTVRTDVSVDGGDTFAIGFDPIPFFTGTGSAVFLLGSDPLAAPTPPPALCSAGGSMAAALRFDGARGTVRLRGTLALGGDASAYDPARDGAQLRIADGTATGTSLLDLTGAASIPPGALGSGCDPDDGWRRRGETLTYRNVSGAFPPACGPGSARGLRTLHVSLRDATAGTVRLRALVLSGLTAPASVAATTFVLGDATAGAAGRCATAQSACASRGTKQRCLSKPR